MAGWYSSSVWFEGEVKVVIGLHTLSFKPECVMHMFTNILLFSDIMISLCKKFSVKPCNLIQFNITEHLPSLSESRV